MAVIGTQQDGAMQALPGGGGGAHHLCQTGQLQRHCVVGVHPVVPIVKQQ